MRETHYLIGKGLEIRLIGLHSGGLAELEQSSFGVFVL